MSKWIVLINSLMDRPENHPVTKVRDEAMSAKARQSKETETKILKIVTELGEASCMNVAEFMPDYSEKYLGSLLIKLALKGKLSGLFRNIDGKRIKFWRVV